MNADESYPAVIPPVLRTATVARPPEEAFAVFTDEIGAWWPLPTHGVFGDRSGGLRFHGGALVETAIDGTTSVWAEVVEWDPPAGFTISWHPGRSEGPSSLVEVAFEADGAGTRVHIRHHGWEAFGAEGLAHRRNKVGPTAWGYVLDHFADIAEGRDDAIDVDLLGQVYEEFFAKAELGGFGLAPDGEWDAEHIVAHVALNDLAMTAVIHGIVHGHEPLFENHTSQDPDNLRATIQACGGMDALIAFGRDCARQLIAAVQRLDSAQQEQPVPCRIEHDGLLVFDEARPWGQFVAQGLPGIHLPAHIGQLEDLITRPE